MSTEENKAVVRRYFDEVWNKNNLDVIDEVVAPDYVNHGSIPGHPTSTREDMKKIEAQGRAAFPDVKWEMHRLTAEGDMVAYHWTAEGTHKGEIMGVKPSGKRVTMTGMVFSRIVNGKIAEQWRVVDVSDVIQKAKAAAEPSMAQH